MNFSTLRQSIRELLDTVVNHVTGAARDTLPQLDRSRLGELELVLDEEGIAWGRVDLDPNQLKPSQDKVDHDKAMDIDLSRIIDVPIVVSASNTVIDGHHQWYAAVQRGVTRVPCFKIYSPTPQAVELCFASLA